MSLSTLTETIRRQNDNDTPTEKFAEEFKLKFKTGDKEKDSVNWVAEVSPKMREQLTKNGRLFIEWGSCPVRDYTAVSRCYRCQSFGHVTKHCRAQKDTCGHCGEDGHTFSNCTKKSKNPTCINCKRNNKPHDHSSRSKDCPAYRYAIEAYLSKVDYGK